MNKLYARHSVPVHMRAFKVARLVLIMLMTTYSVLGYGPAGKAQTRFNITLRNVNVEQVFSAIRKQSNFKILYNDELIRKAGKVSVDVRNGDINDVLNQCFVGQPLGYKIMEETIVITPKVVEHRVSGVGGDVSKPIDVSGKVLNEKNEAVIGATVAVKNSAKATSTNDEGAFFLEGVEPDATLIVSSVSYESQEIALNGRNVVNVQLKLQVNELVGVAVVNTGYQVFKPNEITGSVVVITKEQLDQRVAPDILTKLEGITNGLVFNKKALDGSNELRIRGESTMFGYTEPLIVIDNFPYEGNINDINPNDVESITILKDAAAASIWGVRAGNGVIVITTKRGKLNQRMQISVNANTTIGDKPDLFYAPTIRSSDYIDFEIFLFGKGRYNADLADNNKKVVSPVVEILNNRKLNLISAADSAQQINALRNIDLRNDLYKYLYQRSVSQQYQVSLSGGSNKATYYFSAGYDKDRSNIIGNSGSRITLTNLTHYYPFSNLEVRFGLGYTENASESNGITDIRNTYPYQMLVGADGMQLPIPQRRAVFEDTVTRNGFLNWQYFPLSEREYQDNRIKTLTTRLTAGLKYTIRRGLNIDISYQYNRSLSNTRNLIAEESYFIRDNINKFAIVSNNGKYTGTNYPKGGLLSVLAANTISHNGRANLNYRQRWGQHDIVGIAGIEVREVSKETNGNDFLGYNDATGTFATPDVFKAYPMYPAGNGNFGGGSALGLIYSATLNRFKSYFGDVTYVYRNKYSLFVSIRSDASNYFGVKANNRTVPLWSVGTKWDISKERFYSRFSSSSLSLRATFGYNGNLSPNVAAITTFQYAALPAFQTGLPYASVNNFPNPELRWEKSGQLNVGLDYASKSNNLTIGLDYFIKNGRDLIGDARIDPTTGITQLRGNFSDMKSKGLDLNINVKVINTRFQWASTFFLNYAAEKVTRYDAPKAPGAYLNGHSGDVIPLVGKPLRSVFSYRFAGLDPTSGDPLIYLGDTVNKHFTNQVLNGISIEDLVYNGRYNPPIAGGITNTFSWKGLSISLSINYKFGHLFRRNSIEYFTLAGSGWRSGHSDYALRWQKPGDEKHTNVPSFVYPTVLARDQFYSDSDVLVEKADHIRFQFVNLSYRFADEFLNRIAVKSVQIYFYINNLGIIWRANDKGIDPDYPYLGSPPPRTYSFGIRANL
ncbi:MAG TPA: SusC/RagA family TonB-linked outer membrane protein [Chitinophagaceae bacterium]|nr:SusC/RagA family TonB-linked outer membrane protein [Chitinophagaceae bacterium]